jgi:hypothetical protein
MVFLALKFSLTWKNIRKLTEGQEISGGGLMKEHLKPEIALISQKRGHKKGNRLFLLL